MSIFIFLVRIMLTSSLMKKGKSIKEINLNVIETINSLLLVEYRSIIYDHHKSPYIKFLTIAVAIEYLGACFDDFPFDKDKESENRFNKCLKELFDKKYLKFSKKDANVYLYKHFRCGLIHQLRPNKKIALTYREESIREGTQHLEKFENRLVLVLEDFYDDLEKAAIKLMKNLNSGKITNKKGKEPYLKITRIN